VHLDEWLESRGGVARRSDALAAGFSARAVRRAETLGRWWIASPHADPELAWAARLNVRIACVSAARRLGIAVLTPPAQPHASVAANAGRPAIPGVVLHRTRQIRPVRGLVESLPDLLSHVSTCLPWLEALVIWESALAKGRISATTLRRIPWPHLAARRLAATASAHSESPLETVLADGLRRRGIAFRQQVPLLGHRVDFLIGGLVVQTDGHEFHSSPNDRRRDMEHDARLLLDGRGVLRFDTRHVLGGLERTLDVIDEAVLAHGGQTNRRAGGESP